MTVERLAVLPSATVGLLALAFGAGVSPVAAQPLARTGPHSFQSVSAHANATACRPAPGRIGLARTVEIDTKGGPRFGLQQYKDNDFLRDKEVVLTFDDGPLRRNSRMVLEALAAHCTKATFFMVGRMALADPGMVREIASQGHTIAFHTWSHRNLRAIGKDRAIAEFELGLSMVQRALGRPIAPFFRFPYLADSQAMLAHLGQRDFAAFSIDADSLDFRTRDPRRMQRQIIGTLRQRGKGILLFHDIQNSTAHGIRGVLDELVAGGFKVVHLVAKTPATSIASYDERADKEFVSRAKQLAAYPMLERSVVWPMAAPNAPIERLVPGLATPRKGEAEGNPIARRASSASFTPGAPGQAAREPAPTSQPGPAIRPAPLPRPTEPRPEASTDDGWQTRVFGQ